jgi:predicted negative regulator of RcsB-dependent stress response
MVRTAIILLLLCCCAGSYAAVYTYDYTPNCAKAYQAYLSLHPDEGRGYIVAEMKANPYNLMATYIADYEDCTLLLINCDPHEYEQRAAHLEARLALLEKGNKGTPWYRFCKAGIYFHWAIVATRFGGQYKAAINFHKSFALLKENRNLFPGFEYNSVYTGLQQAVVGALPGNYKWLASIFGMKGDIKKGVAQLDAFVKAHNATQPMYTETQLYYLFTRFYLSAQQEEAWEYMKSPAFPTSNNLLNAFTKTTIALDYKKADAAIATIKEAATDPYYSKYPFFDFLYGAALLTKGDMTCNGYFTKYIKTTKSDVHIKDAWQKMACAWYIIGNTGQAGYCRQQIAKNGTARIDADKQANKFGASNTWPLQRLLQAKLQTDGGYYDKALQTLNSIDKNTLTDAADRVEYLYRMGSIGEAMGEDKNALEYYHAAILAGKERHEQYAARAALRTGIIYEHAGKNIQAITAYKECLAMPDHEMQNSIDQQAKAGLNRIGG